MPKSVPSQITIFWARLRNQPKSIHCQPTNCKDQASTISLFTTGAMSQTGYTSCFRESKHKLDYSVEKTQHRPVKICCSRCSQTTDREIQTETTNRMDRWRIRRDVWSLTWELPVSLTRKIAEYLQSCKAQPHNQKNCKTSVSASVTSRWYYCHVPTYYVEITYHPSMYTEPHHHSHVLGTFQFRM